MATAWQDKRVIHMLSTNQAPGVTNGKPTVVREYNKYMGGVDKADQHRSYYGVGHSSKKWWRCVFSFVVNVCLVQTWILWSKSPHPRGTPDYDNLFLRAKIAEQLRGGFTSRKIQAGRRQKDVVVAPDSIGHHHLARGTKRVCVKCSKEGVKTDAGLPVRSRFYCTWCEVPLCKRQCFWDWHPQ